MTPARQASAIEAEATGQVYLVAEYGGAEYKLFADLDVWPLALISECVTIDGREASVDYGMVAGALAVLLGDQWAQFLVEAPRRGDLIPASHAFAAAAGLAPGPGDPVFGALPRLLRTLEDWPDAVEATLGELGIDYRDRWRFDVDGRRRLTLRQIHNRLSHVGPDSPLGIVANGGRRPLSGTELVLMDLYEAITRTRHPSRPMTTEALAERASVDIEAEREKYRARNTKRSDRRSAAVEMARSWVKPGKDTPA